MVVLMLLVMNLILFAIGSIIETQLKKINETLKQEARDD